MLGKSGIYVILNTTNGHRYVGSAEKLRVRERHHWRRLALGKHINRYLQNAWNLYGEAAFEFVVLHYCERADLVLFEQRAIDLLRPEYNLSPSAGSSLGLSRSLETREKMSEKWRDRRQIGLRLDPEMRERVFLAGCRLRQRELLELAEARKLKEDGRRNNGRKPSADSPDLVLLRHGGEILT